MNSTLHCRNQLINAPIQCFALLLLFQLYNINIFGAKLSTSGIVSCQEFPSLVNNRIITILKVVYTTSSPVRVQLAIKKNNYWFCFCFFSLTQYFEQKSQIFFTKRKAVSDLIRRRLATDCSGSEKIYKIY